MSHPFKIGDVVYHAACGKSEIERIDHDPRWTNPIYLKDYGLVAAGTLSFSPWEKPDWDRPKWKPTLIKGEELIVLSRHSGKYHPITVLDEQQDYVIDDKGNQFPKMSCEFYSRTGLKLQS